MVTMLFSSVSSLGQSSKHSKADVST